MRGFQNTHTKAQDLREIVRTQGGFLTGWNNDAPKSDVGDTQLTVLKNCIPYRDRVEPRGGIKPQTKYLEKSSTDNATIFRAQSGGLMFHDDEWDEIFVDNTSGGLTNYGTIDFDITNCYNYTISGYPKDMERYNDKISINTGAGGTSETALDFSTIEKRASDYFLRPHVVNDDTFAGGGSINVTTSGAGTFYYSFYASFVRIVDGVVVSESPIVDGKSTSHTAELDGTITPFYLFATNTFYPSDYFDTAFTGTDNMYTHVRYYRSKLQSSAIASRGLLDGLVYHVGDYELNSLPTVPTPTTILDLNVTDKDLTTNAARAVYWLDGYENIPPSNITATSSGMYISRNDNKKNEFIYCPIGSGDNEKYFGWYNPLLQYGSVQGEITQIKDMGSYIVITTSARTYYVDTVNYIQDETQQSLGIFTPILPQAVLISDEVGVNENQRRAFVKTSVGSAIAFTSNGEIREFSGYQWGTDLSQGKVHSITKGVIIQGGVNEIAPSDTRDPLYCQAVFVNDTYWLSYRDRIYDGSLPATQYIINTLRLGTTEESGYGFSLITGDGRSEGDAVLDQNTTVLGWPYTSNNFVMNTVFMNIKGVLHVLRRPFVWPFGSGEPIALMEYTGDKFDNKINKDVIDNYNSSAVYQDTTYYDIASEIEFPEITGSYESYFIYFLKSHFHLRADKFAFKVSNESTKGYEITDDKGSGIGELTAVSLSDVVFDMDVRAGESETIQATTEDFSPTSAVTLQRDVQDHRIRIMLKGDSAGFQLTGMQAHFKRHDRTEFEETDTTTNILALNTDLYCRITGKKENLAVGTGRSSFFDVGAPIDGTPMSASPEAIESGVITLTTGPDGVSDTQLYSGIIMGAGSWMEFQAPSLTTPTSATIMFWYKSAQNNSKIVTGWNVSGTDMYEFYTDGSTWFVKNNDYTSNTTIASNESEWTHVAFAFETTNIKVYKNGVLATTVAIGSSLENYIKAPSIRIEGESLYSDIRMYNKEIGSNQMLLYYNNIINNEGDYTNGY